MSGSPIAPRAQALHASELQKDIWLALQRVYGELTYQPGDRPQIFRETLPEEVTNRLLHLIYTVRRVYPFPVFSLKLSRESLGATPDSFESLADELVSLDMYFKRLQDDALRRLCHAHGSPCSAVCGELKEFCARIIECRSSFLLIIALVEELKCNILVQVKQKKLQRRIA